jgi:pyruvate formate lyase activating enzyme
VIYTKGCNFRCPFCHNSSLALGINNESVSQSEAVEYLASRRGFIEGVVVTGGEPCLHSGLGELLASVRGLGFSIKLDTNGYFPEALRGLIDDNLIDYIAMDIKTAWDKYKQAAGVDVDVERLKRSVDLIRRSGIECEFRTTCVPLLVNAEDIEAISRIAGESARYTLQQFQPVDTLNPKYKTLPPYPAVILHDFLEIARHNAPESRLIGV